MENAYHRHLANINCWGANIDRFRQMRTKRHFRRNETKLNSPRTLIEMQKYFEGSFLREDEQEALLKTRDYHKL